MKPKVTVLTTVYNGLPYLEYAIESTLNQTYSNFEYMIIDDASPDKSVVEFIKSFDDPRIKLIENKENLGVSNTINKALSLITTPYVVRLDQDDISLPNRIEEQINFLETHPSISIICSWEKTIDSHGRKIRDWKKTINNYGEFLGPVLLALCPIWHPSIAFRKDALIDAGGFNSDYIRAEDFEVTTRLAVKRHGAAIVQKFHVLHRWHDQRQSNEFLKEQTDMAVRIQKEAINRFLNIEDAEKLGAFLRLKKRNTNNVFDKKYIVEMYDLLMLMLKNVAQKQELNSEELHSLKKVVFKRIGLGVLFVPAYKLLPSFLFMPVFFLLSPLFSNSLHKLLSRIYNALQELRYRFR